MLHTTKKYELGNTIYFECLYRNMNGFPYNPFEPTWQINNVKGAIIGSGSPEKREDGIWYCFWTPLTVGDYLLTFKGIIEDNPVTIRRKFKVIETKI